MELIRLIDDDKEIRRLFGKREIFIIKKQLLGIPLKPSEKTRLSRDIRKKFAAIKSLSECVNEFDLKQGQHTNKLIEEIKEHILDSEFFIKIKRICLYGSVAEKTHLFRSDIDIAVEFFDISKEDEMKFKLRYNYDEKIQVTIYNTLPNKIKKEIDEKGKVLYEKQDR